MTNYATFSTQDITVWQLKNVQSEKINGIIEIGITKFLWFKSLIIRGAQCTDV
ncbi:MAG: hypothetical protein KQH63_15805 [Desulfobulbaceae bacterium]|nr:hypothetical protein [Desulfobulbaceae bacterium]